MGTKSAWTPERRARQAEIIRATQPWKSSTGPKTPEGKAKSSRNAYAGDWYHEAMKKLADNRETTLAMFGRKRFPKGALPDMGRTRAFCRRKDFR
jgi:hypothetical protein